MFYIRETPKHFCMLFVINTVAVLKNGVSNSKHQSALSRSFSDTITCKKLVGCMIVSMAGTMPLQNSTSLVASVAALLPRRCRSEASREPPSGTRQAFEYDDAPSIARTIHVYSSRYSSSEIAWWNTKQTSFHIAQMNTLSRLCFSGQKGVLKK